MIAVYLMKETAHTYKDSGGHSDYVRIIGVALSRDGSMSKLRTVRRGRFNAFGNGTVRYAEENDYTLTIEVMISGRTLYTYTSEKVELFQ